MSFFANIKNLSYNQPDKFKGMKNTNKTNNFFYKISIFNKLKEWQKVTLTIVLGIFITSSGFFGFYYFTDTNFRNNIQGYTTGRNAITRNREEYAKTQLNAINELLVNFDRTGNYYSEYTFADLDIYPDSWVKREFNESERANGLISGPGGDPDGDGLPNKLEFFYGSNPKKSRTLCEGFEVGQKPYDTFPFVCDNRNDKELIDNFISPMTGLDLDTVDKFRVLNQDLAIVNNMKTSFEKASDEGVNLPTLYQQSFLVNYEELLDNYNVRELEDKAVNILEYRNFRFDVVDVLVGDNEITSISQIYTATKPEQFDSLAYQYGQILKRIETIGAPSTYVKTHQLYQLLFESLIDFTNLRKSGIEQNNAQSENYINASKAASIKIGWVYRRLKEEGAKNDGKFN